MSAGMTIRLELLCTIEIRRGPPLLSSSELMLRRATTAMADLLSNI